MLAASFLFSTSSASAATITVNTTTNPSTCTLDEAIENINDGSDIYADCVETGVYGDDDTINLPAGNIVLAADLPEINVPLKLQGQGIGVTVIDGDEGNYDGIKINAATNVSGFTIKAFRNAGIRIADGSAVVDQLEIDGESDVVGGHSEGISDGFAFNNRTAQDVELVASNIYVHHLSLTTNPTGALNGFRVQGGDSAATGSVTATIQNVTVSDIYSTSLTIQSFVIVAVPSGQTGGHEIDAVADNVTVSNIEGTATVAGIAALSAFSTVDFRVNNSTVTNIRGSTGPYGDSTGIGAAGVGSLSNTSIQTSNVIVADAKQNGNSINCRYTDLTNAFGASGTPNISISSVGGNISDDNTCKDYFTEPTDQNNVGNLASTLGTLSDNGGFIPTIPLLENSPAVDAGVNVAGLTTDARLATRPQGNAYDSGAYESPFTKAAAENKESLAGTGASIIPYLILAGVLITPGLRVFKRR